MAQQKSVSQNSLCIALASKRMAHVLMDAGGEIIVFDVKEIPGTDKKKMFEHFKALLECYAPKTVYLQDTSDEHCKLGKAARRVIRAIERKLKASDIPIIRVTKNMVWEALDVKPKSSKRLVAHIVAERNPCLARFLPPARKLWTAEHKNMPIFVAASLGMKGVSEVEM